MGTHPAEHDLEPTTSEELSTHAARTQHRGERDLQVTAGVLQLPQRLCRVGLCMFRLGEASRGQCRRRLVQSALCIPLHPYGSKAATVAKSERELFARKAAMRERAKAGAV